MKDQMESIIVSANWSKLIQKYNPKTVVTKLSYKSCMQVARNIIFWNDRNDDVVNYVVDMLVAIRQQFPTEWDQDWKNDLYLGQLCPFVSRYQESFESYKRAYDRFSDPPALVLYSLAGCYHSPPEVETISEEEAMRLLKRSLEKELTYEAASHLRAFYGLRDDEVNYQYWDAIAKEADRKNLHFAIIVPDGFNQEAS
jgi:hypothetical protein